MEIKNGKHYLNKRGDRLIMEEVERGLFRDQHGTLYNSDGHQLGHVPESTANVCTRLADNS